MAKIAFGPLVANARGKIGGGVWSKSHSGNVVRLRVLPSNPRSSAQSSIRAAMAAAARAFKALSSSDLAEWQTYASGITKSQSVSGQSYHPTPIDAFTALAVKFLQATPAGTIPSTPPATPFTGDTISLTAAGAAGKVTFTPTGSNGSGIKTELLLQKLPSANRKANSGGYRTQTFETTATTTPIDVDGLSAGTYVPAYKFVKTATGQQSGLVVLDPVTVS